MHILRMTHNQQARLERHLFDGSGLEAVAVGLCGYVASGNRIVFALHRIVEIPVEDCIRTPVSVTWPTGPMKALLAEAREGGMALLKIHSHPAGYRAFSEQDDRSDLELFNAIGLKVVGEHVSAIMLPDGSIFGRRVGISGPRDDLDRVSVVGDDLLIWSPTNEEDRTEYDVRHRQMFGDRTTSLLRTLS